MKKHMIQALSLLLALLLLPMPVQASTFDADAFSMNSSDSSITVTIGDANSAVLEGEAEAGRTADATVDCTFGEAYVLHNNEIMESSLGDGRITFSIPSAGDYQIIPGRLFKIANTNMVFGNSLAMNFWIRKSDLNGSGYNAVITKSYADGRENVVNTIPFEQWQDYSDRYYRVSFSGIAAKEMADQVTVQIFNTDGTPASYLYTDSVRQYAMDMLKYYRSGKLATALVDMLNYGASAQKEFAYNTEDLANSQLSEAQQALATPSVTPEDKSVSGDLHVATSLILESNIVLNLYFKEVTEGMYAVAAFTDHYGREQSQTIPYESFIHKEGVGHGVPVSALVVADGRQVVTCKLYNAAGEEVGSCQDSVESYIYAMQGKDTNGLYEATLKFVTSAHAYFHP